jgi:hypothetical protein
MANTDPPNEVDNGKAPSNGDIDAPNAGALEQQVADGGIENADQHGGHGKNHDPENRRVLLQHDPANAVTDRAQIMARAEQGRPHSFWRHYVEFFKFRHQLPAFSPSSGLGLVTEAI